LLNRIIEPIVIILAGLILGRVLGKLTKKILFDLKFKSKVKVHRIGENLVKYLIYVLAVIFAIRNLGIEDTVSRIAIIIGVFVVMLFVSLNLLDFIFNIISYSYVKKTFKAGDKIKIGNIEGVIQKINLTKTKVKPEDNIMIIPNFFIKNNYPK